ncbi:MAG TPA: hypothetical protein VG708_14955 [Mycobacteriales bacterium]|jgi:hypothetical protein|nr:hypothetical protein [Mycobacteriales bacterium]
MAGLSPREPSLPKPLRELIATAIGREHRDDPAAGSTGGPAGNARLTAWTGLVLLVLFLVEVVTLISLHSLLSVHIVVGVILVPLALLKTASTGWRILRYYLGNPAYRQAGPPPLVLRLMGPLVILTSLAVLGSGLALVALGDASHSTLATVLGFRIDAVTVHQACFIAWLAITGLHTLARVVPAVLLAVNARRVRKAVPGVRARAAVVAMALALGGVTGVVVLHDAGAWTHGISFDFDHDHDRDLSIG